MGSRIRLRTCKYKAEIKQRNKIRPTGEIQSACRLHAPRLGMIHIVLLVSTDPTPPARPRSPCTRYGPQSRSAKKKQTSPTGSMWQCNDTGLGPSSEEISRGGGGCLDEDGRWHEAGLSGSLVRHCVFPSQSFRSLFLNITFSDTDLHTKQSRGTKWGQRKHPGSMPTAQWGTVI